MRRVLVVADTPRVTAVIGNALARRGDEVVIETDRDLLEAVTRTDPDVVALVDDVIDRNGLEAIDRMLSAAPTPTLVVASSVDPAVDAEFDGLAHGAVDFLRKPDALETSLSTFVDEFESCIDELADVDVSSLAVAQTTASARSIRAAQSRGATAGSDAVATASAVAVPTTSDRARHSGECDLESIDDPTTTPAVRTRTPTEPPTVVVGASTGGPKLVERLLERLPIALEARVFVVQHMPAPFTPRFAARLDAISEYAVREPTDGDVVRPGTAVVAPGGTHLGVTSDADGTLRVRFEGSTHRGGARPSIDVTMASLADCVDGPLCGVVLTGMGQDGATGIEAIDAAGGHTIAQDEATSSVFGIPAAAIRTGCVDEVVPAAALAERITTAVTGEHDE
ncbi:chemotaxis protein CheB [Natrarchaeobaculum sulfurireducens]|uniref:protein-glutamate methylesterase n=1 Tax=Natrarchaeobaculum sulfurireducens TaxID=2044521 RepID=A0A346PPD8_9EURY|nr:chemotaxis protein CheB [Natrarchaeobaculum sulfurireducens]AXR81383.1 Chemotaxis response regulator protein-glutamatemethylesterase CheB [Natrarchaeobaculum sulfurireducens]